MQFLMSLVGGSGNLILTAALALGFVLVLIALTVWVMKATLKPEMSAMPVHGRRRRLVIVEQVRIDAKRQVVIVRRDDVEHVILTGGPADVVIESGIAAAQPTPMAPAVRRGSVANFIKPAAPAPVVATPAAPKPATASPAEDHPFPDREAPAAPSAPHAQIARLKSFIRPEGVRRSPSLRHTGLLRPVSTMEPAVIPMAPIAGDKSGGTASDSAKTPAGNDASGRVKFGAERFETGRTADNG